MNIFERIKNLNYPVESYIVIGGVLEAHGIRPSNDIDLLVTENYFNQLEKQEWDKIKSYPEQSYGTRKYLRKGDLDIMSHLAYQDKYYVPFDKLMQDSDVMEGIHFINLEELARCKLACGREKDLEDIKLIKEYLKINIE